MLILLPPSETKRVGGTGVLRADALRGGSELADVRAAVRAALVELSRDPEAAAKPLKLGVKNQGELAHNLRLGESGVMPSIERYTGVLYDALDAQSLDRAARAWIDSRVLIQSALFGLIAASDEIPAYRLSAGSRLPALGAPLKRVWSRAHDLVSLEDGGLLLDLRSLDYAALAPLPEGAGYFLNVVQRGRDGTVRALNHFNKAAKGDLVRRLAMAQADPETAEELVAWGADSGLELLVDEAAREVVLVTELGAPKR